MENSKRIKTINDVKSFEDLSKFIDNYEEELEEPKLKEEIINKGTELLNEKIKN